MKKSKTQREHSMISRPQTQQTGHYRNLSQDNEMTILSTRIDDDKISMMTVPHAAYSRKQINKYSPSKIDRGILSKRLTGPGSKAGYISTAMSDRVNFIFYSYR
jgi:hypothetical protein